MKSEEPIDHLNSFLRSRDVSPIRYTLKTPWNDASGRTRRLHERKAKQAVSAVLGEIAPNDPDLLWESIMSSKQNETGNHTCSSGLDKELMYTLANCYKNANERESKISAFPRLYHKLPCNSRPSIRSQDNNIVN